MLGLTADLIDVHGSLPFVDLSRPQEVGTLGQEVEAIVTGADQLAGDVRQCRQDTGA